ncbi:DEAD/DEAH box helicase [uncultured Methanobrevibacter sp.]|uniref:DEAD/DEAH box helicase n=2 Tax=uncultured Methanobrevibacter sp. TaxID=253161 RepID=UPI0025FB30A7|nr:DEAD/DEAH box helicase [uncultured Methanobrevibacter sp.]
MMIEMASRPITKTWWGEKWLDALKGVDYTNRIGRGKTYANTGRVYDIIINDNLALAKVKGNYQSFYNVSVEFKQFSQSEKNTIIKAIYENPTVMSALLNRKLPREVYDLLKSHKVNVFPTSHKDLNTDCNCPDYATICKHIAGLVYMIALEIDKDPFLIFKLRGLDLLDSLNLEIEPTSVKDISELFENSDTPEDSQLDFSKIPDLHAQIFQLLDENPVFYSKDFKSILDNIYKSMARFSKKRCENYTRQGWGTYEWYVKVDFDYDNFKGSEDEYVDWLEEIFLKRWGMPNQWEEFKLNINNNYEISKITTDRTCPITDEALLFGFFTELGESNITKFNKDIRFMNMVYQFSRELIKKHALIPELFKSSKAYHIRWIPAIFDREISKIIDSLTAQCPDELITFKNSKISRKDQIITAASLFVKGFFEKYLSQGTSQAIKKNYGEDVFRLFFIKPQKFKKSPTTPEAISQWLSRFQISSRDYDLYLLVEETARGFDVDICVNDEMENIYDAIGKTNDPLLKTNLLKDTYIINEIYPKFNDTLSLNENLKLNLDDFTNFFLNTLPLFEVMGLKIILPKSLQKIFKPKLKLDITSQNEQSYITFNDLTGFNWKVAIGNTSCSPEEFKRLAEKSKGLVKIANEFVMLDERDVKSLIKQIDRLPEKLNRHDITKAVLSGEIMEGDVEVDGDFDELIESITQFDDINVPQNITAKLRDYQKRGFSWLVQNIRTGFGSILADDMGLGKTLQVLTAIQYLKQEGYLEKEHVLVIAPTSLLTNWQEEIRKFTPDLTSYIFHGTHRRFTKKKYDVYLTSYGVLRSDLAKFKRHKWFLCIIDEAQNIKNPGTKQTKAVKSIKAKHKIAMSGTPVENRLSEYWSIFDFTNKGYLTSLKKFRQNYIVPIEKEKNQDTLNNFRQITQPFILRRLKSDKNIIKDLPNKIVNDIYCNLTKEQVALYKETLDSSMAEVEENEGIKRRGLVLKLINSLKQICNHPSQFTKNSTQDIGESGKTEVLMYTLENILQANEKVLIFTQYVKMGEIIKKLVEDKFSEEVLFLHGSLSRSKRDEQIKKFQNNPQNRIFIISLKAGGTGLNLTAAQNVIHYDLWWNPAVENQATDRAYRIGQKENVMVYRFITKGTFEEKINEMIHDKEELAQLTVGNGETFITEMNTNDLKNMLKLRK